MIRLVREWTGRQTASASLMLGIGDDAAVWWIGDQVMLATTDTMVEGIHFLPDLAPEDLGWKALASNLSDIAAMGGEPGLALVSLAMPGSTDVRWVEELYSGMLAAAREYGATVAGGDMVTAPQIVITVALTGSSDDAQMIMRRSGARPGDILAVTGLLGNSEAGLRVLKGADLPPAHASVMLSAHLHPLPRVAEGQALADLGVRAAIDISDGLLADCGHICRESGVSATIEAVRVPVHPYLREDFAGEFLKMAATGGEDYELLFAAPQALVERAMNTLAIPVTVIGRIGEGPPGSVAIVDEDGRPLDIIGSGWEHFLH